jgi:hypothetical protein
MEAKDTTQRIIQFLKEGQLPFTPPLIWEAAEQLGVEGTPELLQEVMAEGTREAVRAIEKFLDVLKITRRNLSRVETHLRSGNEVEVFPTPRKKKWDVELCVKDSQKKLVEYRYYASPVAVSLSGLRLYARAGLVRLSNDYDFEIVGEGAFFKIREEKFLESHIKAMKTLKPFLSAIGHEGLPEASEALRNLKEGESRLEGRYILARGKDFWALRNWPIMGDPALDGAILSERDVSLDSPGDVEISFKVLWCERSMISTLAYVHFRLGEESLHISSPRNWTSIFGKDVVTSLVQGAIAEEFKDAERRGWGPLGSPSAKMLAFLRAFMEHQAPFQALANGSLSPYVVAELFRDL